MKILPAFDVIRFQSTVREKADGQGHGGGGQHQPKKDDQSQEASDFEKLTHGAISSEQVGDAIHSFQNDSQTQANGLNAVAEGAGPGLKVVLRDGGGAVVRQFTGEEFLRLREAVSKDGRQRGKILDRKL